MAIYETAAELLRGAQKMLDDQDARRKKLVEEAARMPRQERAAPPPHQKSARVLHQETNDDLVAQLPRGMTIAVINGKQHVAADHVYLVCDLGHLHKYSRVGKQASFDCITCSYKLRDEKSAKIRELLESLVGKPFILAATSPVRYHCVAIGLEVIHGDVASVCKNGSKYIMTVPLSYTIDSRTDMLYLLYEAFGDRFGTPYKQDTYAFGPADVNFSSLKVEDVI